MTFAENFLVVVLAATLAIFLIAGIVLLVKLNQIANSIKNITDKAAKLADQAEHVGEFFQKTASTTAIAKLISNIVHSIRKEK